MNASLPTKPEGWTRRDLSPQLDLGLGSGSRFYVPATMFFCEFSQLTEEAFAALMVVCKGGSSTKRASLSGLFQCLLGADIHPPELRNERAFHRTRILQTTKYRLVRYQCRERSSTPGRWLVVGMFLRALGGQLSEKAPGVKLSLHTRAPRTHPYRRCPTHTHGFGYLQNFLSDGTLTSGFRRLV